MGFDSILSLALNIMIGVVISSSVSNNIVDVIIVGRFNEMAKSSTGETGKAAQTRALLFDMTFLMLIHIIQLYGLEVWVFKNHYNQSK